MLLFDKGNFCGILLVIKFFVVNLICKGKVILLFCCFLLFVVLRVLIRIIGGFKIEGFSFVIFVLIDMVFFCFFFMSVDVLVFFELVLLSKMVDFVFWRLDEVDV